MSVVNQALTLARISLSLSPDVEDTNGEPKAAGLNPICPRHDARNKRCEGQGVMCKRIPVKTVVDVFRKTPQNTMAKYHRKQCLAHEDGEHEDQSDRESRPNNHLRRTSSDRRVGYDGRCWARNSTWHSSRNRAW